MIPLYKTLENANQQIVMKIRFMVIWEGSGNGKRAGQKGAEWRVYIPGHQETFGDERCVHYLDYDLMYYISIYVYRSYVCIYNCIL